MESLSRTFCLFQSSTDESSKFIVTTESPNSEMERTVERCGMPLICTSMGTVTCCSTSSAARPGHWVMT